MTRFKQRARRAESVALRRLNVSSRPVSCRHPSPGRSGVMILQILGQPQHTRSIWTIAVVMALPFVYEIGYSQIVTRAHSVQKG